MKNLIISVVLVFGVVATANAGRLVKSESRVNGKIACFYSDGLVILNDWAQGCPVDD